MSEETKDVKKTKEEPKQETPTPEKPKFPSEIVDLPSEGKVYPKDSILSSGKVELKYMTAREEDILTSQNLIEKGAVIKHLLDSLIVTPGITSDDLALGDKNALMVAARILAYGPEYTVNVTNPKTGDNFDHTFNLTECNFKNLPSDLNGQSEFEMELPISKLKCKFKILTGKDETSIERDILGNKKLNNKVDTTMTTRMIHSITEIDGQRDRGVISNFVLNMLARDALALRVEMQRVTPDIDLTQMVEHGGQVVQVDIPLTTEFFWPTSL